MIALAPTCDAAPGKFHLAPDFPAEGQIRAMMQPGGRHAENPRGFVHVHQFIGGLGRCGLALGHAGRDGEHQGW